MDFEKANLTSNALAASRPITVFVPGEILFDLARFQKVQETVLGRLGCDGCNSGYDIRWLLHRDYFVNPAGEVAPVVNEQIGF